MEVSLPRLRTQKNTWNRQLDFAGIKEYYWLQPPEMMDVIAFIYPPPCKDPEGAFKAIQYMIDDTAIQKRIEAGRVPPVKGVKVSDPLLQNVLDAVQKAPSVQLWYDQYLSPELSDLHKSTTQALFGLSKTPEQVDKEMEAKAKELAEKN